MKLFKKGKLSERKKATVKTPGVNAPVREWQRFADGNDWHVVYEAWVNWVERGYEPNIDHDMMIETLLCRRLRQIEQPVLSEGFMERFSEQIISVADKASSDEVRKTVRERYAGSLCYVVEQSGRLRGFALSSELIIVGITPLALFAGDILPLAENMNLRLTDESDTECIMKCRSRLNEMMENVDVPGFDGVFCWLVETKADGEGFVAWYPYAGRFLCVDGYDSSRMLVKI